MSLTQRLVTDLIFQASNPAPLLSPLVNPSSPSGPPALGPIPAGATVIVEHGLHEIRLGPVTPTIVFPDCVSSLVVTAADDQTVTIYNPDLVNAQEVIFRVERKHTIEETPELLVTMLWQGFCSSGGGGPPGPPGPPGPSGPPGPQGPGDLGWYGTGIDGAYVTAGNETLTEDKFFTDLTISAGDTLSTAGFRLYVSGTLAIEPGGFIDNSGSDAVLVLGGAGAPTANLLGGGNGGNGQTFDGPPATPGQNTNFYPSRYAGAGGAGGNAGPGLGGIGNPQIGFGTFMVGTMAIGDAVGGGPGGGGGQEGGADGGGGGGGGGVMVICAKTFNVPASAIRSVGGTGANGTGGTFSSGGGGGNGGVIVIVTNDPVAPTVNIAGGAGGAPVGGGAAGTAGGVGVLIAISPAWGPL